MRNVIIHSMKNVQESMNMQSMKITKESMVMQSMKTMKASKKDGARCRVDHCLYRLNPRQVMHCEQPTDIVLLRRN